MFQFKVFSFWNKLGNYIHEYPNDHYPSLFDNQDSPRH